MMQAETVMMPRELTAENGAKTLLSGEFYSEVVVECQECDGEGESMCNDVCEECGGAGTYTMRVPVSWTTIKEIYRKAVENLAT